MTDKINPSVASAVSSVIEERKEELKSGFQYRCSNAECGQEYPPNSHGPSVCGMCGNEMHVHRPDPVDEPKKPVEGADDVLVSLGDMTGFKLSDLTFGKNYETICLDYVATFNMAVTQGVNPPKALMAMCQATAIVMGQCIVAGLPKEAAAGMVAHILRAAQKANETIRIITKPN